MRTKQNIVTFVLSCTICFSGFLWPCVAKAIDSTSSDINSQEQSTLIPDSSVTSNIESSSQISSVSSQTTIESDAVSSNSSSNVVSQTQQASSTASSSKPTTTSQPKPHDDTDSSKTSFNSSPQIQSENFSSNDIDTTSSFILPEVAVDELSVPHMIASVAEPPSDGSNFILGVIAWACIILGVLIVLVVLFSNKKEKQGFIGRKKYNYRSKNKKRLLPDKYYKNTKKRK